MLFTSQLLFWILVCISTLFSSAAQGNTPDPSLIVKDVWQTIEHEFVGHSYSRELWAKVGDEFTNRPYKDDSDARVAITRMLDRLGEPETRFIRAQQFDVMVKEFTGETGSIGLADPWLRVNGAPDPVEIIYVIAHSPAMQAGVRPHDRIISIDDVPTSSLSRDEVMSLVRGQPGTSVRLRVMRGRRQSNLQIRRDALALRSVRASIQPLGAAAIGYIAIQQFTSNTSKEMQDAILRLDAQHVDGFIVDLRNNPGGFVPGARDIAALFLKKGDLISTSIDRSGTSKQARSSSSGLVHQPVVVLVNNATASAAELLAAALTDNSRAVLVGTPTFGRGVIHSVKGLNDGSALIFASGYLVRRSGAELEGNGIQPDLMVKGDISSDDAGVPRDRQYRVAVKNLKSLIANNTRASVARNMVP